MPFPFTYPPILTLALVQLIKADVQNPSELDLVREALEVVKDSGASHEEKQQALEALLVLLEPIDNANGE
jgi:hypothetical protein